MFSVEAVEVAAEKKMFIFSNQLCVFCVVLAEIVVKYDNHRVAIKDTKHRLK